MQGDIEQREAHLNTEKQRLEADKVRLTTKGEIGLLKTFTYCIVPQ